jgi:hypothetical protein
MSAPAVTATVAQDELDLPLVVTHLMKGVVYQDIHAKVWRHLLQLQPQVRDYVETIGLVVVVDEAEGYAFLRSRSENVDDRSDRSGPQRLIPRHSLSFPVSLLLALLRKHLAEFDVSDSGTRCVLSRDQIVQLMRVFVPETSNEARLVDDVDRTITKVVDFGFLRRVKDQPGMFEVRRILKAFVDAQWLAGFDVELSRYVARVRGDAEETDEGGTE